MAKKYRLKPRLDVEYTFIFPGNIEYTWRCCGENEKGYLMFVNVKTNKFIKPISVARFNYLYERQLKCQKAISLTVHVNENQFEAKVDEWPSRLDTASDKQKARLKECFGKSVDEIKQDYIEARRSDNVAKWIDARYTFIKIFAEA